MYLEILEMHVHYAIGNELHACAVENKKYHWSK